MRKKSHPHCHGIGLWRRRSDADFHGGARGAVNAVLHGNNYAPDKKVTLAFERTPDDLVITIRDQGKGIDLDWYSESSGAGKSAQDLGPGNFSYAFFYGRGGNPPVPDRY
jgi:hypothetical protein